jgi:hypothetical protein
MMERTRDDNSEAAATTTTKTTTATTKVTSWSPQVLTQNNVGYPPIPENDYIKQY